MMRLSRWLIATLLLSLLIAGETFARGDITLDEAVENARKRVGGRVISAETQETNGQRIHNIRLLTKDGKVKRIRIDSESGSRVNGRRSR